MKLTLYQLRSVAWKTIEELLGLTITGSASGTPSATTYLRGDWTWGTPAGGGGAPTDAEYLVKSSNGGLSAERVITDTASVIWDYATPGQAKASVPNLSGTNTGDQTLAGLDGVPTSRTVAGHALSSNVTLVKGDVGLSNVDNTSDSAKPVSTATQTALDAKAAASHTHTATEISDSTATGRAVLTAVSQAAARTAIGAGTSSFDGAYGSLSGIPSTFAPIIGGGGTQACAGNDSRLSDARTPTAHAASHKSGGSDAIKLDELAAPTDVTTLDATTSAHGLMQKYPGGTSSFLRADGAFAAPTAAAADPVYSPGSITVATETSRTSSRRLKLTGSQRATIQGTGCLRIT